MKKSQTPKNAYFLTPLSNALEHAKVISSMFLKSPKVIAVKLGGNGLENIMRKFWNILSSLYIAEFYLLTILFLLLCLRDTGLSFSFLIRSFSGFGIITLAMTKWIGKYVPFFFFMEKLSIISSYSAWRLSLVSTSRPRIFFLGVFNYRLW